MTKVNISPRIHFNKRKEFLKEYNLAFVDMDIPEIQKYLSDDIHWNLVGEKVINGKEDFLQLLEDMKGPVMTEINFEAMNTHGKEAAVHGSMTMDDGKQYRFADLYIFKSAGSNMLKSLTSYVMQV